jgi:hypothetical protein
VLTSACAIEQAAQEADYATKEEDYVEAKKKAADLDSSEVRAPIRASTRARTRASIDRGFGSVMPLRHCWRRRPLRSACAQEDTTTSSGKTFTQKNYRAHHGGKDVAGYEAAQAASKAAILASEEDYVQAKAGNPPGPASPM